MFLHHPVEMWLWHIAYFRDNLSVPPSATITTVEWRGHYYNMWVLEGAVGQGAIIIINGFQVLGRWAMEACEVRVIGGWGKVLRVGVQWLRVGTLILWLIISINKAILVALTSGGITPNIITLFQSPLLVIHILVAGNPQIILSCIFLVRNHSD